MAAVSKERQQGLSPTPDEGGSEVPRIWTQTAGKAVAALETDLTQGLTAEQAERRLRENGRNELANDRGPSAGALLAAQFKSVVIWVLIGAAVVSFGLGEVADAVAIAAIVFLNALIGFYQEYRAECAVAALRKMAAPLARVVRGGHALVIPAPEVVRGDLLLLEAGDLVAADARLVEASSLRANEAPLTGESTPVGKHAGEVALGAPLAERYNMTYFGTSIVGGQGRAVVVATGMQTEVGRIASLLHRAGVDETPLQRRLDRVGRTLLVASLAIVVVVFLLGLLRGEAAGRLFLTAVSLAVAAIPEGLPAVVTVALSLGVARMVRRNALMRRLPAVETLGCAQVICSDKTGTLTLGQMTVRALWTAGRELEVTGEGYSLEGAFLERAEPVDLQHDGAVRDVLRVGVACNEAELCQKDGRAGIVGDPTEGALLVAAAKAGVLREAVEQELPRMRVLPFDSERKRMTVIRTTPAGPRAFVKGAPDVLLTECRRWIAPGGESHELTTADQRVILNANQRLAERGLRVLAMAYRDLAADAALGSPLERVEADLTFAGLLAMYDPPRAEAKEAIGRCREAGIRPVMITGDHPGTAAAVARELGILSPGDEVASGAQIQQLSDEELARRVEGIAVYARVTAEDKLRVVRAFKRRGMVVAMTGDGVNDAPAVKEASIGVAMGITGTEVTKEASDMVITDDNFASIVAAVEEGRGIYDNIKKCLQYLLAGNTAEILVMLVAVVIGWPIPLTPLQILWINLVTDGFPALALATDPVDKGVLQRPPRRTDEQLTDGTFLRKMVLTGALTAGVALLAFYYGLVVERDLTAARNYVFTAVVYAELLRALGVRSPDRPFWAGNPFENTRLVAVIAGSVVLQLAIHHVPALQRLFGIGPMSMQSCLALLFLGVVPLLILESQKVWVRRGSVSPRPNL